MTTSNFTDAERAAMVERAKEAQAAKRRISKEEKAALAVQDVLDKIAEMPDADRAKAEKIHTIVLAAAPDLAPRTWYGMPAYANTDGKLVCFFQPAAKFGVRYATIGFEENAHLDDGNMWATSFALMEITEAEVKRITDLVKKAVS